MTWARWDRGMAAISRTVAKVSYGCRVAACGAFAVLLMAAWFGPWLALAWCHLGLPCPLPPSDL
jgi:hypothetical protein